MKEVGKVLSIQDYTLKFDKAADIIYFHMTGQQRLDSRMTPRRSATNSIFKKVQRKKSDKLRRKKENDSVLQKLNLKKKPDYL